MQRSPVFQHRAPEETVDLTHSFNETFPPHRSIGSGLRDSSECQRRRIPVQLTLADVQRYNQQFNHYQFRPDLYQPFSWTSPQMYMQFYQPQFALSTCPPAQQETSLGETLAKGFLLAVVGGIGTAVGTAIYSRFVQK